MLVTVSLRWIVAHPPGYPAEAYKKFSLDMTNHFDVFTLRHYYLVSPYMINLEDRRCSPILEIHSFVGNPGDDAII